MNRREKSSGLTPQERSVMDLWDAGWGMGAISRQTTVPLGSVRRIVTMYDASEAPDRLYAKRCRIADAAFLAAIAASGGRFA